MTIEICVTLGIGIVGSIIATYIVRFIDKIRKNDRHESRNGH